LPGNCAKVAEAIPDRIRRLIFLDAFVLNDGESLRDSLPPHQALFDSLARESDDHTLVMPFELWRDSMMLTSNWLDPVTHDYHLNRINRGLTSWT